MKSSGADRGRKVAEQLVAYLRERELILTTAESCTAGTIISLLADVEGSGARMDCGYVVYSLPSKLRLLQVKKSTVDRFNLTSEQVAREMAAGALHNSAADVAIATTGVAGPDAVDGIEPGTVCLAWGFRHGGELFLFSRTEHFRGDRQYVRCAAAEHAIAMVGYFHRRMLAGERG